MHVHLAHERARHQQQRQDSMTLCHGRTQNGEACRNKVKDGRYCHHHAKQGLHLSALGDAGAAGAAVAGAAAAAAAAAAEAVAAAVAGVTPCPSRRGHCQGRTTEGAPCKNLPLEDCHYCHVHHTDPPAAGGGVQSESTRCRGVTGGGQRCRRAVADGSYCHDHRPEHHSGSPAAAAWCGGTTKEGHRCSNAAADGGAYCRHHSRPSSSTASAEHSAATAHCSGVTAKGLACQNSADDSGYCRHHHPGKPHAPPSPPLPTETAPPEGEQLLVRPRRRCPRRGGATAGPLLSSDERDALKELRLQIRKGVTGQREVVERYRGGVDLYTRGRVLVGDRPEVDHIVELQVVACAMVRSLRGRACSEPLASAVRDALHGDGALPNFNVTTKPINVSKGTVFTHYLSDGMQSELGLRGAALNDSLACFRCFNNIVAAVNDAFPLVQGVLQDTRRSDGHVGDFRCISDQLEEIHRRMDIDED